MAIKTRLEPVEKELSLLFPEDFSDAARSKALASFAREAFEETDAQNTQILGHRAPHDVFVDGRAGVQLESVRPDGKIVFEWELLEEVLTWIDRQLFTHSPWRTGRYTRSHILVVDGHIADIKKTVSFRDEAFFANVQPYARKIERGLSAQAPAGVYQGIARLAADRFGNLARIRFGYRSLIVGGIDEWARRTNMPSKSKGAAREDWLRRQPAIIVTFR